MSLPIVRVLAFGPLYNMPYFPVWMEGFRAMPGFPYRARELQLVSVQAFRFLARSRRPPCLRLVVFARNFTRRAGFGRASSLPSRYL